MWLRSHSFFVISVFLSVGVGSVLGAQRAASENTTSVPVELPKPQTTDPRRPVEVYTVPPFLSEEADILQALRIATYTEDHVVLRYGATLGIGGQLVIERALPVTVIDANQKSVYRTWQNTVGTLLDEQRIEVGERDKVAPAQNSVLVADTVITITRVSVTEINKSETIAFATKTQEDPARPRGEKKTVQKGASGKKVLTYQVTRENGKEVGRKLLKTEITQQPADEIISVGTRVINAGQGKASWYDPPWSGLTAAHNTLPKGTMVDVVAIKTGKRVTVEIDDRGIYTDAIIDLSPEAFKQLAPLGAGIIQVKLEIPG